MSKKRLSKLCLFFTPQLRTTGPTLGLPLNLHPCRNSALLMVVHTAMQLVSSPAVLPLSHIPRSQAMEAPVQSPCPGALVLSTRVSSLPFHLCLNSISTSLILLTLGRTKESRRPRPQSLRGYFHTELLSTFKVSEMAAEKWFVASFSGFGDFHPSTLKVFRNTSVSSPQEERKKGSCISKEGENQYFETTHLEFSSHSCPPPP